MTDPAVGLDIPSERLGARGGESLDDRLSLAIELASLAGPLRRVAEGLAFRTDKEGQDDRSSLDPLWGGDRRKTNSWFASERGVDLCIDDTYRRFEDLLQVDTTELHLEVPVLIKLLPALYRVRSLYEYVKETKLALAILASDDPSRALEMIGEREAFWAASRQLQKALQGKQRVLLAGSGPLPLTAYCLASQMGCQVTCLERDGLAFALGRRVLECASNLGIRHVQADIHAYEPGDAFDAAIATVLLGVDQHGHGTTDRAAAITHLLHGMTPGVSLVTREPNRMGWLLYPSLDLTRFSDFEIDVFHPRTGDGDFFQCSVLRIEARHE